VERTVSQGKIPGRSLQLKFTKMDVYPVICPTCFEEFTVPLPPVEETPAEVDYDCEVCCRPMMVSYYEEDGEVAASARGMEE